MRCVASTHDGWKYRDLLIFDHFSPSSSSLLYLHILIYMGFGAPYKRGPNLSYLDCCTPKLFWWPRWGVSLVPRIGESTGTSWYLTIVHPAPYSIYIYWYIWVLGAPYKRGPNFSYLHCYTPKLFWWPRWDVWLVSRMGESTGSSSYFTLFDPAPYSIYVYWYI